MEMERLINFYPPNGAEQYWQAHPTEKTWIISQAKTEQLKSEAVTVAQLGLDLACVKLATIDGFPHYVMTVPKLLGKNGR